MIARTTSRLTLALTAICALLPLMAGIACWRQWQAFDKSRMELSQMAVSQGPVACGDDEIARLDNERLALSAQIARLSGELNILQRKQMPVEPDASRRLVLELLDLAASCGLDVVDVTPLGDDPRVAAQAAGADNDAVAGQAVPRGGVASFLGRFPGNVRRPLVQLRCQATYPAIHRFFAEMKALRWNVTPVLFNMGNERAAQADAGDEAAPTNLGARDDGSLRLMVVVAL